MNVKTEIARGLQALESFRNNLCKFHRRPIVLLVEDDKNDAFLAMRQLAMFNIDCHCAESSKEAIRLIDQISFDVVLLDLKLDHDSGLDVISYAKNANSNAIFITLTGIDDKDPMISESLDRGAAFVIRKPLSEEHVKTIFGQI